MNSKVIRQAAAVLAAGWSVSATAPVLAGTLLEQLTRS